MRFPKDQSSLPKKEVSAPLVGGTRYVLLAEPI